MSEQFLRESIELINVTFVLLVYLKQLVEHEIDKSVQLPLKYLSRALRIVPEAAFDCLQPKLLFLQLLLNELQL